MKDNLENIGFSAVISQDGKTYTDLKKELKPSYKKVFWDLAKGYLFLGLILFVDAILIQKGLFNIFIAFPVSVFLAGYCLAYLHLFVHAAAHYNIHEDKLKNDRISDLFIGVFFGLSQKNYRKTHWLHHSNLGTKDDSEHSYFNELTVVFFLKCLTGIHTASTILSRIKTSREKTKAKISWRYLLYTVLFHTLLLLVLFISGGWMLLLIWIVALAVVFPLLATLRQLIEHRDLRASGKINYHATDHGKVSRLFGKGLIDSSFGAAGFNKHLLHHWDPTVSYTCLNKVEDFLAECPQTAPIIRESKTSYLKIFIALFKI